MVVWALGYFSQNIGNLKICELFAKTAYIFTSELMIKTRITLAQVFEPIDWVLNYSNYAFISILGPVDVILFRVTKATMATHRLRHSLCNLASV